MLNAGTLTRMPRNTVEPAAMVKLPELKFPYGVVERALAVAYQIPDAVRPAGFRSMLANLQKMGSLGLQARVGRGAALTYTPVEMHRLVLALEFSEFGLPPATVVGLLDTYWDSTLWPIIYAAARPIGLLPEEPEGKDTVLFLGGGGLRTDSLRGEKGPVVPIIDRCSLDELPDAMRRWMTTTPNARGLIMNLSARLRAFHSALAVTNLEDALDERQAALTEGRAALAGDKRPKARK
jgi:hypothetical protein